MILVFVAQNSCSSSPTPKPVAKIKRSFVFIGNNVHVIKLVFRRCLMDQVHSALWKNEKFSLTQIFFVKSTKSNLSETIALTKFLRQV